MVGGAVTTLGLAALSARAVVLGGRTEEPAVVADVGLPHYRFELPDGMLQPTAHGTRGFWRAPTRQLKDSFGFRTHPEAKYFNV